MTVQAYALAGDAAPCLWDKGCAAILGLGFPIVVV